jgi:hypothetical protein
MALASFPDGSYLELLALQPHTGAGVMERHAWSRFIQGDAGPCAWAVSTNDLDGELRPLRAAGIPVQGPVSNGRLRPDGVRLEWETAAPGAGPAGSFFPFLIRDITARDLRAFPQGAPGNRDFRGIARVVLAVRNLDAAAVRYRQAFGLAAAVKHTDPAFGAQLGMPAGAPIVLAQPLDPDSWLGMRLEKFGEAPCAILLEAVDAQPHAGGIQSRWLDLDIRWFDSHALGWRLGVSRRRTGSIAGGC